MGIGTPRHNLVKTTERLVEANGGQIKLDSFSQAMQQAILLLQLAAKDKAAADLTRRELMARLELLTAAIPGRAQQEGDGGGVRHPGCVHAPKVE